MKTFRQATPHRRGNASACHRAPYQCRWRCSIAIALSLLAASATPAADEDGGTQAEPEAAETVLVLGDSLSAGYGFALDRGWVNLLRERLRGRYRVVNASVSGDTTTGGMARLGPLLALHQPSIVIIELGGNDGLRGLPVANIRANLMALAEAVVESGATPVLAGMRIHPNYGPRYTEAFHRVYAEVVETTGGVLVPFLLEGVATNPDLMQRDRVHPNAKAQARLLENVWQVLAPLVR